MASLVVKFVIGILVIGMAAMAADMIRCVRVYDVGQRNVRSFNQLENSDVAKRLVDQRREKREGPSIYESLKCKLRGAIFNEQLTEHKFRASFANEVHLNGDNKANLQLAWTGQDYEVGIAFYEKLIVVTSELRLSSVFLGDKSGNQFKNITEIIEKNDFSELTLLKHSNDSKIVYLVANPLIGIYTLYVSLDGAEKFQKVPLKFKLESAVVFHPTRTNLILAKDDFTKVLYLSKDKGLSWTKIKSNVLAAKWGTGLWVDQIFVITNNNTEKIVKVTSTASSVMEKSIDFGSTWKQLRDRIYTFGMGDKFVYASVYKDRTPGSDRFLIVSTDAGESWNEVHLPVITPERFYSILDSTEGQIFLHVDHPGDTGRGTLYTSDATGIVFSESLANHLYSNYEDLTDFYRVLSMRGVYIASQLLEDDIIHTMITFDRGGKWQPIRRPEGVPCKDETKECHLQIHNLYSIKRGIFADPPLSVPNAAGIILVHGHVADALQTTAPDVFVTSDGGYTWRLALKGPHHYEIADHGGLLLAVPSNTETPSTVKFSTDEGRCWISYDFTEKQIVFTGLLISPGNRDMTVAIWGYTREDRTWHTHLLNFNTIIDKQCDANDYEDWVPHQHNDNKGCLLGSKETFRRLKADSWCYNGKSYEVTKKSEICPCTENDFDCDYGYKRIGEICVNDTSATFKEINICMRGHEEKVVPIGYRKIPGDRCLGGFFPADAKAIDLGSLCRSDPSYFAIGLKLWYFALWCAAESFCITIVSEIGSYLQSHARNGITWLVYVIMEHLLYLLTCWIIHEEHFPILLIAFMTYHLVYFMYLMWTVDWTSAEMSMLSAVSLLLLTASFVILMCHQCLTCLFCIAVIGVIYYHRQLRMCFWFIIYLFQLKWPKLFGTSDIQRTSSNLTISTATEIHQQPPNAEITNENMSFFQCAVLILTHAVNFSELVQLSKIPWQQQLLIKEFFNMSEHMRLAKNSLEKESVDFYNIQKLLTMVYQNGFIVKPNTKNIQMERNIAAFVEWLLTILPEAFRPFLISPDVLSHKYTSPTVAALLWQYGTSRDCRTAHRQKCYSTLTRSNEILNSKIQLLIDLVNLDVLEMRESYCSVIKDYMCGQMLVLARCIHCNSSHIFTKTFCVLDVPFLKIGPECAYIASLYDCLKCLSKPEMETGACRSVVSTCTCPAFVTTVKTQLYVEKLPKYLFLKLARFSVENRKQVKSYQRVRVTLQSLDMSCVQYVVQKEPVLFDLCAFVVHEGTCFSSGHYVLYILSLQGRWNKVKGDDVKDVDIEHELAQDSVQSNIYFLAYKKQVNV